MQKRILVIDDDLASVSAAKRLLNGAGYEVLVASNAADAEVELEHDDPVLVILSLATDGHSGLEICASIRDLAKDPMLPVLMIGSGDGPVVDVASALANGGDGFFQRPVPWGEVVAKVEAYLGVDSNKTQIGALSDMEAAGRIDLDAQDEGPSPEGAQREDAAEGAEAGAWEVTEPGRVEAPPEEEAP